MDYSFFRSILDCVFVQTYITTINIAICTVEGVFPTPNCN